MGQRHRGPGALQGLRLLRRFQGGRLVFEPSSLSTEYMIYVSHGADSGCAPVMWEAGGARCSGQNRPSQKLRTCTEASRKRTPSSSQNLPLMVVVLPRVPSHPSSPLLFLTSQNPHAGPHWGNLAALLPCPASFRDLFLSSPCPLDLSVLLLELSLPGCTAFAPLLFAFVLLTQVGASKTSGLDRLSPYLPSLMVPCPAAAPSVTSCRSFPGVQPWTPPGELGSHF